MTNLRVALLPFALLVMFAAPFATIGTAHADTPAQPSTAYVVTDDAASQRVADCITWLGWTGDPTDGREAVYAPTFVIAECSIAPVGMVPVSTDDVTPAVWSELIAIGYHGDPTDGTDDVVFVPKGTAGHLQMIADGINR